MSRRKFNLGDIIRKINEDGEQKDSSETPSAEAAVPPKKASQSYTPDESGTAGAVSSEKSNSIPPQPLFGSGRRHYSSDYTPPPPPVNRTPPVPESGNDSIDSNLFGRQGDKVSVHHDNSDRKDGADQLTPGSTPYSLTTVKDEEEDEEEQFDIFKYLGILLRRKYIIIIVLVLATLFSFMRYLKGDTYYIAKARLLFRPDNQQIINERPTLRYFGDREKNFTPYPGNPYQFTLQPHGQPPFGGPDEGNSGLFTPYHFR